MGLKIISGDSHIDLAWLPPDLFISNAPPHLRDKMPYVKETGEGLRWHVGETAIPWVGNGGSGFGEDRYVPGLSRRLDRMEELGFFSDGQKGIFRATTPELRMRDQETDGVEGEVIYGILGVAQGFGGQPDQAGSGDATNQLTGANDPEVVVALYEIYNEWVAEFCKSAPSRFAGLACITGSDPKLASRQLRRAAEIGLRGAELDVSTVVEPIYHRDWDVLWATAAECGMPISFHTLGLPSRQPKDSDQAEYQWVSTGLLYTLFQLSGAEFLTSIILSGACDRYVNFKFVLGECGIGWIPYVLQRMDQEYENFASNIGLTMKPSDFWRRQGYSTFQDEFLTKELIRDAGEDSIIWGSDYPHPDGIWPDSRRFIQENLGHLDETTRSKLVYDNAAKLYGFSKGK